MKHEFAWIVVAQSVEGSGAKARSRNRDAARLKSCLSTIVSTSIKLTELGKTRQSSVARHRSFGSSWLRTSGAEQRYALALSRSPASVYFTTKAGCLRCARDERALFAQGREHSCATPAFRH